MMAFRIALFIMIFSATLGYVQETGLFSYQHGAVNSVTASDIMSETPNIVNYTSKTVDIYIFGDFLRVLNTLAILIKSALLPVYMLEGFGIPHTIAVLINLLCAAFYAMAVLQVLGNRSERLMR